MVAEAGACRARVQMRHFFITPQVKLAMSCSGGAILLTQRFIAFFLRNLLRTPLTRIMTHWAADPAGSKNAFQMIGIRVVSEVILVR